MTTSKLTPRQRKDKTGFRSSREEQFFNAWVAFNPFGDDGIPKHDYSFTDERGWLLDFAWPSVKVAVEVHGFGGGHQSIVGLARDAEKHRACILGGWILIPMTSSCLGSKAKVEDMCHMVADTIMNREQGLFGPQLS